MNEFYNRLLGITKVVNGIKYDVFVSVRNVLCRTFRNSVATGTPHHFKVLVPSEFLTCVWSFRECC